MSRFTGHLLLVLLGGVTLRVAAGDAYLAYVQAGFRPLLLAAGALVLLVGLVGVVRDRPGTSHDEHPAPPVAWLLLAPVVVLLVVAPGPLGSFTAGRQAAPVVAEEPDRPLGIGADDPGQDHRTMTLSGYAVRTQQSDLGPLQGRQVRLVGFLSPREGGGWYVARIQIACCAADARAVQVVLAGPDADELLAGLAADQWVEVVGGYAPSRPHPTLGHPEPALDLRSVTPVATPADGYED